MMFALFKRPLITHILISIASGILIFIISWFYLNSYYTLSVEDTLYAKESFFKHKLLKLKPKKNKKFVFISTGKDLSLIDDTAGSGNIVVSDRYKIFKLLQAINKSKSKPEYILLDMQFYYPFNYTVDDSIKKIIRRDNLGAYFADKSIDDSLQAEINKNKNIIISVLLTDNKIDKPLYKAKYGIADYKTYGSTVNKFRINYADLHAGSVPSLLHQQMDGASYSEGRITSFCNNRLCFNYIWPVYYYNEQSVKTDTTYQLYHIGSLTALPNSAQIIGDMVKGKVVFVGNFEDDVHDTPAGSIPGTIILADIYLSLLNGTHYISYLWILFLIVSFSALSYISIYNKLPKIEFDFGIAANLAYSFISEYFSYLGILMALSLISVLLFNVNVSLFLPASIFSGIEFFIQKKYKPKHT